ncbi:hypothetical protein DJFAAGMI_01280 [Comamonas sp. PE63]|uniref:DUF2213 domain-containing protein n=1 Tax=Comamonas brasiliensis TaxID=1812482 RepID=A0ABS5LPW6_9BURK|nr:hypothetical protein [Comamonas sp. PE63]MBS3018548.1 hypothetical protein [Comamonas sp. PE63]
MSKKRIHIISAVNAANVSKSGTTYTIRDVCGAVDDIVMNRRLYPADQLAAGIKTLEGKPAPAGHPRNSQGQHISAAHGEALASAWIGAYCTNARHEGGRSVTDVIVNGDMAQATDKGRQLVQRLDAAIAGTNAEPIHVSTGLNLIEVLANGESRGKKYQSIATNLQYDHLAILLDEAGAGTPEQGVGMFLNSEGGEQEIETVRVSQDPEDRRYEGAMGWLRSLFANSGISFDQIYEGLRVGLPENAWVREVFSTHAVWTDEAGKLWRQDYQTSESGSVAWFGQPVEVVRQVSYEPITHHQEVDIVKEQIIAALNAAGIKTEGLSDTQVLAAYNALVNKPLEEKLTAANSRISALEADQAAVVNAERDALAAELAANSSLTVDDFKLMPLERLKELKAKAAPVIVGSSMVHKQPGDEFKGYSINSLIEEGAK